MDAEKLEKLVRLHTNLNVFGNVIALLEGGNVYSGTGSEKAENRIIDICKQETIRLVGKYDSLLDELRKEGGNA